MLINSINFELLISSNAFLEAPVAYYFRNEEQYHL
jgi:hypothetical protein